MNSDKQAKADDSREYQRSFRKKIFTLLNMGYGRLDVASLTNSEEEDITGEIVKEINEILEDRESPSWVSSFAVHEELRINEPDRKGKRRKRVDIDFEWICHGPRQHYSFEAKRLRVNSHPIGEYVGLSGLGEFISGNYAHGGIEAGMIGYIQSDTPESWASKILKKFKKEPEIIQACSDGGWADITIVDGLKHCFRSKHHRPTIGRPITIYHIFFVFY